ncbi:MAG: hypothetical protein ABR548_02915 [Actinomycetota bacterium]|nr:hypothetical protein [Actinomycetota bacterium]
MGIRGKVSGAVGLVALIIPLTGHAAETRTSGAPYDYSRNDIHSCSVVSTASSCTTVDYPDERTGHMALSVTLQSASGGTLPSVGSGESQPEIWGTMPVDHATSKIVVRATYHVREAHAWRDGSIASASGRALAYASADAYLYVNLWRDCYITDGCTRDPCPLTCGYSASARLVDISTGQTDMSAQDVVVTVTLQPEIGMLPAGTLSFGGVLFGAASLGSFTLPDDGTAGVSVDATLTSVVADLS